MSSGGLASIPPPRGLVLEHQFVEGGKYTVSIQWESLQTLPEGMTGYSVYVNGDHNCNINDPEKTNVLLTGIARKQVRWC